MKEKIVIYQIFTRLYGNRNTTRKEGGTIEENGCGKLNDFTPSALKAMREMGVSHIWYTGVIRHATQTDYSAYGIPKNHPAVVKGKAGSPYAITDYYDIDPDFVDPYLPTTAKEPDMRFTDVNDFKTSPFAIVNEAEGKAFYCTFGQHLAYADYNTAFKETTSGYYFKLAKGSGGYRLKLITPDGNDYNVGGNIGYLNTQAISGDNCFISGEMNGQNGQDIEKGAIWSIDYVDGKGWTIKNVGTGKYLKDSASPANHDEPTYFTFCTLKEATTGINEKVIVDGEKSAAATGWFTLDGRKLSEKPTQQGLYIVNGKTVVIK